MWDNIPSAIPFHNIWNIDNFGNVKNSFVNKDQAMILSYNTENSEKSHVLIYQTLFLLEYFWGWGKLIILYYLQFTWWIASHFWKGRQFLPKKRQRRICLQEPHAAAPRAFPGQAELLGLPSTHGQPAEPDDASPTCKDIKPGPRAQGSGNWLILRNENQFGSMLLVGFFYT